jgi:DNA polymerase III alpha subunit
MANRDLDFYSQFNSYDGCVKPGVRLPEINIESKYYKELGIDKNVSNFEFLQILCDKEAKKRGLSDKKEYQDRLKLELQTFDELGFVDYILLNWDILNFCHEKGIPVGKGRGSAPSSYVLYLLRVTDIDPIEHGLFFERFVSKSRAKKTVEDGVVFLEGSLLPDVDSDISYDRRKEVIDYIESRHKGKTSKILTLNTLSGKLCIKECGKIVGEMSESDVNDVSDLIPKLHGKVFALEKAYRHDEKFKDWVDKNERIFKIARKIEGLNKNTGVHPSGIAISFYPIDEILPTQKTSDGELISAYDMNDVAALTVKFDILGLRTLTVVDEVCKTLDIVANDIDVNDPFIYSNLQDLKTPQGLFQIEADTNYRVCRKVKPKNLEQLSAVIALGRPGSLMFTDDYADYVNNGILKEGTGVKALDDVFSKTANVCLFQESLMQAVVAVGFTPEEAEQLRRCVTGDTRFFSKTRGWIKIDTLLKEGFKNDLFLLMNQWGEQYWKPIRDIWSNGKKQIRYVECKNGLSIKASMHHQFLTNNGWKARMRLNLEDSIVTCANYQTQFGKKTISDHLAIILAGMMTEGYYVYDAATFTNYDKEIYDLFLHSVSSEYKENDFTQRPCGKVIALKKKINEDLTKYMNRGKSAHKSIPEIIFRQDKETVKKFISFSFACEATMTEEELSLTSKSRELINGLQLILLQFGIRTTCSIKNDKEYGEYHVVNISPAGNGKYLQIFKDNFFEYIQDYKKAKLNKYLETQKTRQLSGPSGDSVPTSIVKQFMDQYPFVAHELGCASGRFYGGTSSEISFPVFKKMCEHVKDKNWNNFSKGNVIYSKVKSLDKDIREIEVFDFSIDEETPFIVANGMVIHNCVGKKKIKEMPAWKEKIAKKVKENNLDSKASDLLWKICEESANYSFNKCLSLDTTVETENGSKMLFEVKTKDLIRAFDVDKKQDFFVEVLDVIHGTAELYEVELEDGRKIKASLKHKFLCEDLVMRSLSEILEKNLPAFRVGRIKFIKKIGVQPTIDLEVAHKDHNFYAEGIIVSNSHSAAYATLSATTTYLKFKYPQQFFLALLKLAKYEPDIHGEINKISKELVYFDIELLSPDLIKSELDFSIEGKDIRFGLNAIKGVSDKTLENLNKFRETGKLNKYDVFLTAKQSGINIGLLSTLIQAGTLSSCQTRRSRMVLEAQTFNILTDKEKKIAYDFGEKYDFDVLKCVHDLAFVQNYKPEKGGSFMNEKRKATFSKKYSEYKKIYEQNRDKEDFANWYFESKLLGYNPSINIKQLFSGGSEELVDMLEFGSMEENEHVKIAGTVEDVRKGKTKKTGNTYYKIRVRDEYGSVDGLFMDAGKYHRLTEYTENGNKIPEKDDIVIISGRKGEDCVWLDGIKIEDQHIFMKLSDVK